MDGQISAMQAFCESANVSFKAVTTTGLTLLNADKMEANAVSAIAVPPIRARFGNRCQTIRHAAMVARGLQVSRVYLPFFPEFPLTSPRRLVDLDFLPFDSPASILEPALMGTFFHTASMRTLTKHMYGREQEAVDTYVSPLFAFDRPTVPRDASHLAIHLRAGDVFKTKPPHPNFIQPPLAFYILAIQHFSESHTDPFVTLVFQDRGNPVIDALEAWLRDRGVRHDAVSSATLDGDLHVLFQHQTLVFGRGSFGRAVYSLSHVARAVYFPWTDHGEYGTLARAKGRGFLIAEREPRYISVGDWRNTPEQRALMLSYALENLVLSPVASHATQSR